MRNKYLFIKHYITPAPEVDTSMKNYGSQGKKVVDERASFSHHITKKNLAEASYIFDLENKKVVKNRFLDNEEAVSNEDALEHYFKEYRVEISRAFPNFE